MKNIALAMSARGFPTAAFFYLNYLQYDRKTLRDSTHFKAPTSGGSFTSSAYALGIYNGNGFGSL